ncbi:MAG: O-methyltransferase [Crocinitomicaceae bacterium]|nr:O-methyltransferase [Crocinitomicaceae bacterium]
MEILDQTLLDYCEQHTSAESEALHTLNRKTHLEVLSPIMLSGHLQGRVLSFISKLIQPKFILELGTYTGYSALCMLEGLHPEGKLITIDNNEELEPIIEEFLKQDARANQVDFRIGNGLDIIPSLPNDIDLVFIDADKSNYSNYFDAVIDKVRMGGIILADNVLWKGKVVTGATDKTTKVLMEFNAKVQADPRVENVLLPIRDGIMAIRKIA